MEFEGIVIRTTPFREHDAMVTVLSNDKMQSFLARGALKFESKLGFTVNNYVKSRFFITRGKDGYSLRNGELLKSYENIKKDIVSLAVQDFIGELTNKLVLSDDASKIYPYLEKSLDLLNDGFSPWTVALIYFAKVLDISGYSLNVDSCQICGKKDSIIALSYKDGGFICKRCFSPLNHKKTPVMKLKMARYIFMVGIENFAKVEFPKDDCLDLIKELDKFLMNLNGFNLKSIELLRKL